jgi:pimeloyl-ACP methyl ester carboxylesterase
MASARLSPRPAGGAAYVAAGLLATAVGAGIGLPHAAKTGLSVATVAGLALLLVGLVLCGLGVRSVLRGMRRRYWILLVPLILVVGYVVVWSLGLAVAVNTVPRTALGERTPASLGLRYEDVRFETSDGVELAGWYLPSRNGAAVALMHGAGSTRSAVLNQAAVLAEHGYGVLLFDARGHGQSGGRAMDFGWYGDADVGAAVDVLAERDDVDPARIGAVGMSMGGEEAIGAAAGDSRIRAVVAEGATNRVAGDKAWLPEEYGVRGTLQQGMDRLTYAATDLLTGADPPVTLREAVAASDPDDRFLLITAGGTPDELHAAEYIRGGSPTQVTIWTVDGAGHTGGLRTAPDQWERRVTGFLDRSLGE